MSHLHIFFHIGLSPRGAKLDAPIDKDCWDRYTPRRYALFTVIAEKYYEALLHEFLRLQIDDYFRFFKVLNYIKSGRCNLWMQTIMFQI
jgi:hypothetical protein